MFQKLMKNQLISRGVLTAFLLGTFLGKALPVSAAAKTPVDKSILYIVQELDKKIPNNGSVLFMEFQNLDGRTTPFCRYFSERIHINLSENQSRTVLDRRSIGALMEEKKLVDLGLLNERTAIEVGKTAGTKTVVFGTLADLGKTIGLNIKIVDIENGTLVGGLTHNIKKGKALNQLLSSLDVRDTSHYEMSGLERRVLEIRMQAALNERIKQKNEKQVANTDVSVGEENQDIKSLFNSLYPTY